MPSATTTTYEIERKGGERLRFTIPSDWKVTYGPVIGEARHHGGDAGNVLRIYEAKDKQRALFTRVESFRDLSIPCEKETVRRSSESEQVSGPKGAKAKANEVVERVWEAA